MARRRKLPAYTSSTLAVSRKMLAPGPHHEQHAIIRDLIWRIRGIEKSLRYYDRTTGKAIADKAASLRKQAQERIDRLPAGDLRTNLTRELYGN